MKHHLIHKASRRSVLRLAVAGMSLGSPGMKGTDSYAGIRHAYNVLLVLKDGSAPCF